MYPWIINETWAMLAENSQAQMAMWSCARNSYASLYFAFEDFFVRVVKAKTNNPDYKSFNFLRDLVPDFKAAFDNDEELTNNCLNNTVVKIARLARNDIVHNGGRESEKLREENHDIVVKDGELQIKPKDVRCLYNCLISKVDLVASRMTNQAPGPL